MGLPDRSGLFDCHPARPLPLVSFQGPLSVFSTKNRWQLVGPVHMTRGEGGFGFTLRGDSPVLIAAVVPGSQAEVKVLRPLVLRSQTIKVCHHLTDPHSP